MPGSGDFDDLHRCADEPGRDAACLPNHADAGSGTGRTRRRSGNAADATRSCRSCATGTDAASRTGSGSHAARWRTAGTAKARIGTSQTRPGSSPGLFFA